MKNIKFNCKDGYLLNSKLLNVVKEKNIIITISVKESLIKKVITNQYFNLFPEVINYSSFDKFNLNYPVEIKLALDKEFSELLSSLIGDLDEKKIQEYLVFKSSKNKNGIFLFSESWFALSVLQERKPSKEFNENRSEKIGFYTKWKF